MKSKALLLEEKIRRHHQSQLDLCMRLETIADNLPDNYDRQECLSIAQHVYPTVRSAHQFEEQELFPFLLPAVLSKEEVRKSIERLKFEHWEDESSAEDISVSLRQMIQHPESANIGEISYMLRGFFEGLRRHIAFEIDHLLPKLREIQ